MRDILRIAAPLTAWLSAFSAVYALEGLVCSWRWADAGLSVSAGRVALIGAWGAAMALQLVLLLGLHATRFASPSGFVRRVSLVLAGAALVATAWTLLPVATSATCR